VLDPDRWAAVPFPFWAGVFFVLGCVVGSFLNVCIHRLPRGESLVRPGSHCPHCNRSIPWYLNLPLASWLWLRGRCRFCQAPIPIRYFLVELLTGTLFLCCWLAYGRTSTLLALVYCVFVAGLIAAAFIDIEHFIIPDGITLGGIVAGLAASFLAPLLHRVHAPSDALLRSAIGAALGWLLIYGIVRAGKFFLGRQRHPLPPRSRLYFQEDRLVLPDQEIPYAELLYRDTDAIVLQADEVELPDRGYRNVPVRLTRSTLKVGADEFPSESVVCFEAVTDALVLPREAMGLGDVKFMAAIGAFLGWAGVLFSLMLSALVGSVVGVTQILSGRKSRSDPIQYGPYLALAALIWVLAGDEILRWWLGR